MSMLRLWPCLLPWVAACASAPADAPPASATTTAFAVPHDYQGAYRRVLENARRCWPATTPAGQSDVQGTLDDPNRAAHLAFAFRSRAGSDTRLVVDLRAADRERTDVRVSGPPSSAAVVRGWLEGTSLDCP